VLNEVATNLAATGLGTDVDPLQLTGSAIHSSKSGTANYCASEVGKQNATVWLGVLAR
jgi:hypothetical protein